MGGIKTFIGHILNHGDFEAFEYVLIIPKDEEFIKFCDLKNVKYHIVNAKRSINLTDVTVFFKVLRIIRNEAPDVIHCHSAKGGFLGRLCARLSYNKARVIYTPNAFSHLSFTGFKRVFFYLLEYIAKSWTNVLLAVSYSEANRAVFEFGYNQKNVSVVLNSVDVNEELSNKNYDSGVHINTISRLSHQKNPMLFVNVARTIVAKHLNASFNILGAGMLDTLRPDVELFIAENRLGDKVKIHNWGTQETSKSVLAQTDIFVMTSTFEGLPFSLLEAMANGIPCVVAKTDGNTDVIQNNENGFSCLSKEEFVVKIEQLMESKELRRQMGIAGYEYVKKHHNSKYNIAAINKLYQSL